MIEEKKGQEGKNRCRQIAGQIEVYFPASSEVVCGFDDYSTQASVLFKASVRFSVKQSSISLATSYTTTVVSALVHLMVIYLWKYSRRLPQDLLRDDNLDITGCILMRLRRDKQA